MITTLHAVFLSYPFVSQSVIEGIEGKCIFSNNSLKEISKKYPGGVWLDELRGLLTVHIPTAVATGKLHKVMLTMCASKETLLPLKSYWAMIFYSACSASRLSSEAGVGSSPIMEQKVFIVVPFMPVVLKLV